MLRQTRDVCDAPRGMVTDAALSQSIKRYAHSLGFDLVAITTPDALTYRMNDLAHWQSMGFAGEMRYMREFQGRFTRLRERFPDVRSIIALAVSYAQVEEPNAALPQAMAEEGDGVMTTGRVARYAWGEDYHDVIRERLQELADALPQLTGRPVRTLAYVDTGPLLERAIAEAAGIGFIGKNTNVITQRGSWVFLAELLCDIELESDAPIIGSCGSCTLCIQACPTGAIVEPYQLDARRCISYLTIECKEEIPTELRRGVGPWVYGCDICQEVCPFNRRVEQNRWNALTPSRHDSRELGIAEILAIRRDEDFRLHFRGRALTRPKRRGLLRNAAVVAGNARDHLLVAPLTDALAHDAEALVRGHAAWALGEIGGAGALDVLRACAEHETDVAVTCEIQQAIAKIGPLQ